MITDFSGFATSVIRGFTLEENLQDFFDIFKEQKEWCQYFSELMEKESKQK